MLREALDKKGKEIFSLLKNFKDFYLAGGTALALQVKHRISVDFDLFTEKKISKNHLNKVKTVFTGKQISVSVNNPDELTVFVDEKKVTFLNYPFLLLLKLRNFGGIKLLDIKEIGATKAYTIGRRGSYKDYIDLFFIIHGKYCGLQEIIDISVKKYGSDFNSRLFLEQLLFLEDISDEPIIFLKNKIAKVAIIKFFESEIKKIKL